MRPSIEGMNLKIALRPLDSPLRGCCSGRDPVTKMDSVVHRPARSVVVRIMLKPRYPWLLLLNEPDSVSFVTPDLRLCVDTVR